MFVQTKANVKQHEDILCIIKWLNSQTDMRKAYTPSLVNEHIECMSIQQKRLLFKNNLKNLNLNLKNKATSESDTGDSSSLVKLASLALSSAAAAAAASPS